MHKRALVLVLIFMLAFGSVFSTPVIAAAEIGEADYLAAAVLLGKYGLVQGDERGLRLTDDISRAELAKVLVLALGMESQVKEYEGRQDFIDIAGHWAHAYIALARRLGLMRGYPEGTFRPQAPVSYAELVTVLSRLVGLEASSEPWPRTYMGPAKQAGIIPDGMSGIQNLQGAATRGDVFVLLKRTVADVKNYAGQTLLQRYLDKTPPELTIDPQPRETAAVQLAVSGSAGDAAAVRINGMPVAVEYGYYARDVDLRLGPNTIRVQAFDDAGNMSEDAVVVTRVAGSAAAVEFSGPSKVVAGQSAQFNLVLRDRYGEELGRAQAEVTIAPNLGTFDVNTGRFVAGSAPGQGKITVFAGSAQASANIEVIVGSLERIAVEPAEITLGPDQSHTFIAIGYDAKGNPLPVTDVTWSASAGTISAAGLFKSGSTPATVTVTALSNGRTATATVRPVNYRVASVTVATKAAKSPTANGKDEVQGTAVLRDATGAPVTDYQGTVTVTSSAPGTLAPTQTAVNVIDGVASFTMRAGATAGTATVTVTTNLNKAGNTAVIVGRQQIQSIRLTGRQLATADGTTRAAVEALALDQEGNPMLSPLNQTMLVRLTITPNGGGTWVASSTAIHDLPMGTVNPSTGDMRSSAEILYTAGIGTLTISGTVTTANLSYVSVLAGAVTAMPVGQPQQVRIEPIPETVAGQVRQVSVNLVDQDGFRVTNIATGTYSVMLRDQNGATWSPSTGPSGAAQGKATFDVTQNVAGTYTYTATLLPGGYSATFTTAVVPDRVASVTLTATPSTLPANNLSQATLKAALFDAYGNKVTAGTYPVTFTKTTSTGATQSFATRVVSSVGGEASVTVSAGTIVASETYTISVPNQSPIGQPVLPASTATATLTTLGATPHRLQIDYANNVNTVTAGLPITVQVSVRDINGNLLTYDNDRSVTLTVRHATSLVTSTLTGKTANGIVEFQVNRSDTGTMAVKAESGDLIKGLSVSFGGTAQDLVVQPGLSTKFRVAPDLSVIKSDGGRSYARVQVSLLDPNNNVTPNQTGLPINVTLALSTLTYGYFTVDDIYNGVQVSQRTVTIAPGATTSAPVKYFSTGTAGGVTVSGSTVDGGAASTTITTAGIGGVYTLRVEPITAAVMEPWVNADSVVTGQTVVVTAIDSNGTRVTDFGWNSTDELKLTTESDARIVAAWEVGAQTWVTKDTTPNNGVGDYGTLLSVRADRGQVIFRVRASSAGLKVYKAGYGTNAAVLTTTGEFLPSSPDHIALQVDRRTITGGGDQVAVRARVRDAYGNTLTHITGPVLFSVNATTAGRLLTNTAELVNGVATVYFQSELNVAGPDPTVTVNAWSTALKRADGSALSIGSSSLNPATDSFVVDATPRLIDLAVTNAATNGVTIGDTITFTFNEAIDAVTVPTDTATMQVKFDAPTSTITFPGIPGLGTVFLWPGAIPESRTYGVQAISVVGTSIVVAVGDQVSPAPDGSVMDVVWTAQTLSVTMNGATRNSQGSGAFGPFSPITPSAFDF